MWKNEIAITEITSNNYVLAKHNEYFYSDDIGAGQMPVQLTTNVRHLSPSVRYVHLLYLLVYAEFIRTLGQVHMGLNSQVTLMSATPVGNSWDTNTKF